MSFRNKVELKKTIFISFITVTVMIIMFAIFYRYQYKTYTKNFNNKINSIAEIIVAKYPEVEKVEIIKILNSKTDRTEILKTYGIDINEDSAIIENDESFTKFLIADISYLIILSITIIAIFLTYNYLKDRKLKQITKYIEEINNGNYKLDISDNTEDELSILKNEIYKTTIMLKEVAENSKQDKLKLKDSLSDISHQLKTPLTSITIMLDNISNNPDMDLDTRSEFIKDIKREVINVNFLINSLLKLSKLDANSIKFINKEESVKEILKESIKNLSALSDLKNVKIVLKENNTSKLYCDLKWQVEAITNILKNCIEHSIEGSSIDITYNQNNVYTKIEIIDHGIGIDKKDLPHIFERFYKGKNSSNESIGIGLALAKTIIEKNNGYIDVESEEGKGTKFTIKYMHNIR